MSRFLPSSRFQWASASHDDLTVWAHGHAFREGSHFTGKGLARFVRDALGSGEVVSAVMESLSGQFALAVQQGETLWLCADAIRTVPLFYDARSGMGSDAIDSLCADRGYLPDSVTEYATAGFITGPYTLFRDIRTVQAGEIVRLEQGRATPIEYYDLRNSYEDDSEDASVLARLDDVVMHCMERAATMCAGRQVVIPLSGGLDSRLIAASFKRLGYDKVICFSYGLKDNWEASKARNVAETLGLEWFPVEFTAGQLRRDYHSEEMREFWRYAGQGSTLPSVPEWPGIRLAHLDARVEPDAVFLSGQSGDFINGSHLKYLLDPEWCDDPQDVTRAIFSKHYSLWRDLAQSDEVRGAVGRRVGEILADFDLTSQAGAARAYEFWECRERQLKYVVQGGRVFDFFDHEWWMPLWDREIIDFFKPVSTGLKMRGYLYAKYLAEHDPFGVFQDARPAARFDVERVRAALRKRNTPRRRFKAWINTLPGIRGASERRRWQREHRHYYRHSPLGFPRIYGEDEYVNQHLAKRHVLSLWLKDFLMAEYGIDPTRLAEHLGGAHD